MEEIESGNRKWKRENVVTGNMLLEIRDLYVFVPLQNHIKVQWLHGNNFA